MEKKITKTELLHTIDKTKQKELCDFFGINEKSLRKALIQTNDGKVKINLLKMKFDEPVDWLNEYNSMLPIIKNLQISTISDNFIDIVKSLYSSVTHTSKFKKYKTSIKNDSRLKFELSCLTNIISDLKETEDQSQRHFYAHLIYAHCDLLLKDTDMI